MSKYEFKVGDRVRIRSWDDMAKEFGLGTDEYINSPIHSFIEEMRPLCGETATIKEIYENSTVKLGCWNTAADTFWSFTTGMLEPAFIIGHCYKVYDDPIGRKDNIIKVTNSDETHFHYKTIRGKDTCDSARNNSTFAYCLVPLYGKQIGQAIRQWDAKHVKTKVREVKRKAKVGETVKVVKAQNAYTYKNGDILTVIRISPTGGIQVKDPYGGDAYLYNSEYVVLENYKTAGSKPKEVKRKAKAGEYIKIIGNHNLPSIYNVGEIHKVTNDTAYSVSHAGIDVDDEYVVISHEDYVVLEGYKPKEKGKHSYTAKEVERAKELCKDMMAKVIEKGAENISIDFNRSDRRNTGCFVMAAGEAHVRMGFATCSSHDVPNEWIGRCIALCKALKKPIPNFILEGGK